MITRKKQRDQILGILIAARGEWVPLPVIMDRAAQYNARILELRRLGFTIENRTKTVDGARHSWFRLAQSRTAPSPQRTVDISQESGTLFDLTRPGVTL